MQFYEMNQFWYPMEQNIKTIYAFVPEKFILRIAYTIIFEQD